MKKIKELIKFKNDFKFNKFKKKESKMKNSIKNKNEFLENINLEQIDIEIENLKNLKKTEHFLFHLEKASLIMA